MIGFSFTQFASSFRKFHFFSSKVIFKPKTSAKILNEERYKRYISEYIKIEKKTIPGKNTIKQS